MHASGFKPLLAASLLASCAAIPESHTVVVPSEARHSPGPGFRSVRVGVPSTDGEKVRYTCYVYYNDRFLDEARLEEGSVSPSGRFAVFESATCGGIVLFDSSSSLTYRIFKNGEAAYVEDWSSNEDAFLMSYYTNGNFKTVVVRRSELRQIDLKRPEPNKAPEPTSRSVTSRANVPLIELKQQNPNRLQARAAPEQAVAHL